MTTKQRWTQLEFFGLNSKPASLQCARIKTFVPWYTRSSITKFILGYALRENNLTKRITLLLAGERKMKMHLNNFKQTADI